MPLASGGDSALVRISHELLPCSGKGVDVFFVLGFLGCGHMVGNTSVVFGDEVVAFGNANLLAATGRGGGRVARPFRGLGIAVAPGH